MRPNLDESRRAYRILTPKLVAHTQFVSHEHVTLSYSKYIYGASYGTTPQDAAAPDSDVLELSGFVWW